MSLLPWVDDHEPETRDVKDLPTEYAQKPIKPPKPHEGETLRELITRLKMRKYHEEES
jgi:hypothetical protein